MERNGQRHVSQRVTKHFKTPLSIPSRLVILVALNTQLVGLQDSRSYLTANSTSDPTCLHSCSQSPRLLLPNVFARCRPPRHIKTSLVTHPAHHSPQHDTLPHLFPHLTHRRHPTCIHRLIIQPGILPRRLVRLTNQRINLGPLHRLVPADAAAALGMRLRVLVLTYRAASVSISAERLMIRPTALCALNHEGGQHETYRGCPRWGLSASDRCSGRCLQHLARRDRGFGCIWSRYPRAGSWRRRSSRPSLKHLKTWSAVFLFFTQCITVCLLTRCERRVGEVEGAVCVDWLRGVDCVETAI